MIALMMTRLGITELVAKLILYAIAVLVAVVVLLTVRQHYVNKGWDKAIAAVKKQDNVAADAAKRVQERAAKCDSTNGYWDVVTQDCRLGDDETTTTEEKK